MTSLLKSTRAPLPWRAVVLRPSFLRSTAALRPDRTALLVERAAATSAGAPLRRVQQLCGPLNHNGHIVADIHEAMDDWVSCGVGPWFYNGEREERWLKQEADGGGRVGKLRPTQLYYGEPTVRAPPPPCRARTP